MLNVKNWIVIIAMLVSFAGRSQLQNRPDWSSDLEFLRVELPKRHINFFVVRSREDFDRGIENISSVKDGLSDLGIALKLQQLIAGFGDSHTSIQWQRFIQRNRILPIHLVWFKDGLFVLHTTWEHRKILGCRLTKINGMAIESITDSLSTLIPNDNKALLKSRVPGLIPFVQVLEHFAIVDSNAVELQLENLQGEVLDYKMQPVPMNPRNRVGYQPDSLALCYRNERAFFMDYYQSRDRIYYLQYNKCWSKELELKYRNGRNASRMPSFSQFQKRVFKILKHQPVDKLVVDMRFNGGGNSLQGSEFIQKLSSCKDINQKGKLYVVLGRRTFSSAILNAMDFAKMTEAIFVGEETGGKPNHFGEFKTFALPATGMKVNYSTKFFRRTKRDLNTLTPDFIIETSFEEFSKGIDPVYEWIKAKN
jgi:hypothetical protein